MLLDLLDSHAPLVTKTVTVRSTAPWFTDELRQVKQEKRRAERKYMKSHLEVDKQIYKEHCKSYKKLLDEAKKDHHKSSILESSTRDLFRTVNTLSNPNSERSLPSHDSEEELAERFADYFEQKINTIRSDIDSCEPPTLSVTAAENCSSSFTQFEVLSEEDVRKIILDSPTKSCPLDAFPTSLLKNCLDSLLPVITSMVNLSLSTGTIPLSLKMAQVCPILKKPQLDKETLKSYRPVSQLKFIAKLIERCCLQQIQHYMDSNHLYSRAQSAYRPHHSCETALLRVQNDLLRAIDRKKEAILVLLDFSAAFDTIDHDIFLQRLSQRYGIGGTALNWFRSYLQDRTQSVSIGKAVSSPHHLRYGVPQGSVAGAPGFTYYSAPLSDIINLHGLNHTIYADDTQVYILFDPCHQDAQIDLLEGCIKDIKAWAIQNKMKFNDAKTEIMHFHSHFVASNPPSTLTIGDSLVDITHEARNLGILFEDTLSMEKHIANVCRAGWACIRRIGKLRKYLDAAATEKLAHAFITSRIDCCNSLLLGLPDKMILHLQRLQNATARLVCCAKRSEHITPLLHRLHWLPVQQRIIFKTLLLTFKCLHNMAPAYLCELISRYKPRRTLRSSTLTLLEVPPLPRTVSYGAWTFAAQAPSLWNELPESIRSIDSISHFKRSVKTHLFNQYYQYYD